MGRAAVGGAGRGKPRDGSRGEKAPPWHGWGTARDRPLKGAEARGTAS